MSNPVALPRMNPVSRFLRHKRWVYSFVATPEVIALNAIVDLGYASNAFFLVADRAARTVLSNRGFAGLPRPFAQVNDLPAEGLRAHFRAPGFRAESRGEGGAYHQRVQAKGLLWLGELATQGTPLALTAPVANGGANFTQKWAALEARGQLEVGSRSFDLRDGVGGIDYTNGLLARRTAWRWAFACGRLEEDGTRIGLNLVEGFNEAPGASENALFVGNELLPLGRAHFSWNKNDPLAPWHCASETRKGEDGDTSIDLAFEPMGAHREARDWRIVKSRFVQPVGHFSGILKVRGRVHQVKDLAGVTEDQDIVW